jgi:hypothetical protein
MGLRDLFDSDPRSKKELRQELERSQAALSDALKRLELRPEDLDERKRLLDLEEKRIKSKETEINLLDRQTALLRLTLTLAAKALEKSKADVSGREQSASQRETAVSARENAQQVQLVNLTRREQDVAVRESKVAERERLEKELVVSRGKVSSLEGEVSTLRSSQKKLMDDAKRLQQDLLAERDRADTASTKSRELAQEVRELRKVLKRAFLLRCSSSEVLHWLAGLHAHEVQQVLGETPVTLGSGPWEDLVFDAALESAGFVPQLLDDEASSFEVFVVGQDGVDLDALAEALKQRLDQGAPVRLYSQELWLLHLMTGCDPLELDEAVLIEVFAHSHKVLGAFVNEEWNWPSLNGGSRPPPPPLEKGKSPLHAFGYSASKRTDAATRRAKLKEFLECRHMKPYFDESLHDLAYRNSWGPPGSSARLRRMVHHIRWLIGFQGASADKAEACQNWNEDLAWIRKVLAPRAGVRVDAGTS